MEQNYWNVDDILADSQKLSCTFNVDVPNMGQLQSTDERDIKQHARVELPFWMAEMLALHNIVSITMPKAFGPRVRGALDANPKSVLLRQQNVHWYALGMRLGQLMDSDELMGVLSKTYSGRIAQIYEQTQHLSASAAVATGSSTSGLTGTGSNSNKEQVITTASTSAIAAMLNDGPALGMSAGSGLSQEMTEFIQGLDESERQLLRQGQEAARKMKEYLAGSS